MREKGWGRGRRVESVQNGEGDGGRIFYSEENLRRRNRSCECVSKGY